MYEKNKEKNNSNKKGCSGIIIFILLIIIVILSLYICYEKGLLGTKEEKNVVTVKQKTKKEKTNSKEDWEVLEVVSNDVTHLFSTLTTGKGIPCGIWDYFTDEEVTSEDISNTLASSIALNSLYNNGIAIDRKNTTFTSKQLNSEIKKIFGKDYEYENENIDLCPTYEYDSENKIYTVGKEKCINTCNTPNQAKIVKAYKTSDELIIYVRVLFTNLNEEIPTIFYKDFNKTEPLEMENLKTNNYYISDDLYEKGALYKMTFTLEDGNYIFVSSQNESN